MLVRMKKIRLARTVFAALMMAALVGLPARPTLCDIATPDVAAVVAGHHHEAPLGAGIADGTTCLECDDMTGCCLAPSGALDAAAPQIPTTPIAAQDDVMVREHLASDLVPPLTPPPRA